MQINRYTCEYDLIDFREDQTGDYLKVWELVAAFGCNDATELIPTLNKYIDDAKRMEKLLSMCSEIDRISDLDDGVISLTLKFKPDIETSQFLRDKARTIIDSINPEHQK